MENDPLNHQTLFEKNDRPIECNGVMPGLMFGQRLQQCHAKHTDLALHPTETRIARTIAVEIVVVANPVTDACTAPVGPVAITIAVEARSQAAHGAVAACGNIESENERKQENNAKKKEQKKPYTPFTVSKHFAKPCTVTVACFLENLRDWEGASGEKKIEICAKKMNI